MSERILNILRGAGSVLNIWPEPDREHKQYCKDLEEFFEGRPDGFEMVMLDMRRVMLRNLDMMSDDERQRTESYLRPGGFTEYERRLGLDKEPENGQLKFSFSE